MDKDRGQTNVSRGKGRPTGAGGTRSVERALSILLLFSRERTELGITEAAESLNLPKATVHRLITTLSDQGFLVREPTGRYRLGPSLRFLGSLAIVDGGQPIVATAMPFMESLRDVLDETVTLNVVREYARVCIEKLESSQAVRTVPEVGRLYPLYAGASGKVLLAFLPPEDIESVIRNVPKSGVETTRPFDGDALRSELDEIRRLGVATSERERTGHSVAASAPIRDHKGHVVAGLSVSSPAFRVSKERLQMMAKAVKECAKEVSHALGYHQQHHGRVY